MLGHHEPCTTSQPLAPSLPPCLQDPRHPMLRFERPPAELNEDGSRPRIVSDANRAAKIESLRQELAAAKAGQLVDAGELPQSLPLAHGGRGVRRLRGFSQLCGPAWHVRACTWQRQTVLRRVGSEKGWLWTLGRPRQRLGVSVRRVLLPRQPLAASCLVLASWLQRQSPCQSTCLLL